MVLITKRTNNPAALLLLHKKTAPKAVAYLSLAIVFCIGILWLSCLVSVVIVVPSPPSGRVSFPPLKQSKKAVLGAVDVNFDGEDDESDGGDGHHRLSPRSSSIEVVANSILTRLDNLSHSVPISSSSHRPAVTEKGDEDARSSSSSSEVKLLAASMKECLPGRDDASGQINPTTRKERECLRHVPYARKRNNESDGHIGGGGGEDVGMFDGKAKRRRPRIGIMIPPGYIGRSFGDWIADALGIDDGGGGIPSDDIEIVITSHVPVYGYGKSHGYTKLVRLVTLPLSLAAYDAYYYSFSSSSSSMGPGDNLSSVTEDDVRRDEGLSSSLRGRSNSDGANSSPSSSMAPTKPTATTIGLIVRLLMRWQCRLSHVSAHSAMVTLSLEDVLRDPARALGRVLSFVRRDDWQWEGHEKLLEKKDEKRTAVDVRLESMRALLDRVSLVVGAASFLYADSDGGAEAYRKSIRDAFAYEMERSSNLSVWPCPSFWEGVDGGIIGSVEDRNNDNGDGDDQTLVLRRIAGEMVPNCSDDEPFAQCTVSKDRCEMKGDAKCN